MDIIVKKLSPILNDDCLGEIMSFLYDPVTGYNATELDCIRTLNVRNRNQFLRIKVELMTWKDTGRSICWLRPVRMRNGGGIYRGAYRNISDELYFVNQAGTRRWISQSEADDIINEISVTP